MLQIPFIRNNQELVLEGLAKRNFVNAKEIIERVLETDKTRRNIQVLLDNTLAESNAISKEIGILFKTGQIQKAALAKEKSKKLKDQSKNFTDQLNTYSKKLQELLFQIPNIPHTSVPSGQTEEDNEEVFKEGIIPELHKNALPHWEFFLYIV